MAMNLKLKFEVGDYNGTMGLLLINNNQVLYSSLPNELKEGIHSIECNVNSGSFDIISYGKDKNDTLVSNNNILKDKFIDIKNISLNGFVLERFHIYHSSLFFENYFSKNEKKTFNIPNKENILNWYLKILEDHKNNEH